MKRITILLLLLAFVSSVVVAQTAREEIDARPHISVNAHGVYAAPYFFEPIAKAPKGYEPFYISHYGRHGSRYESTLKNIDNVENIFLKADSLGVLTTKGREILAYIKEFSAYHKGCEGELTPLGVEQHKGIARRMYNRFKSVLTPGSLVESKSSVYNRCIMSMASFNESLKECQPKLRTNMETGERHALIVRPTTQQNPLMPRGVTVSNVHKGQKYMDDLAVWGDKQNLAPALKAMFTDTSELKPKAYFSDIAFLTYIYTRLAFYQNFGWQRPEFLDIIFPPDVRYAIYGYVNYWWYNAHVSTAWPISRKVLASTRPLVEDIINNADLAIEGKNSAVANLRFGHDYFLLSLLGVISFNEYSAEIDISDIDAFNNKWRGFRAISMASNLQMILYRNKKGGDILVRFLHNENDVTLPIESDKAPFYKWSDVKQYMLGRLEFLAK